MPCPAAHPRKGHIRKHVLVSADQDHSSTEVNSIENWAVKTVRNYTSKTWEMLRWQDF